MNGVFLHVTLVLLYSKKLFFGLNSTLEQSAESIGEIQHLFCWFYKQVLLVNIWKQEYRRPKYYEIVFSQRQGGRQHRQLVHQLLNHLFCFEYSWEHIWINIQVRLLQNLENGRQGPSLIIFVRISPCPTPFKDLKYWHLPVLPLCSMATLYPIKYPCSCIT